MEFNRALKIDGCCAQEVTRYALTAVKLDVEGKRLVATDGKMLAIIPCEPGDGDVSGLIPADAFKSVRRSPKALPGRILANGVAKVTGKAGEETFPRTEGTFPDFTQVLRPKDFGGELARVMLDADALATIAHAIGEDGCVMLVLPTNPASAMRVFPLAQRGRGEASFTADARGVLMPISMSYATRNAPLPDMATGKVGAAEPKVTPAKVAESIAHNDALDGRHTPKRGRKAAPTLPPAPFKTGEKVWATNAQGERMPGVISLVGWLPFPGCWSFEVDGLDGKRIFGRLALEARTEDVPTPVAPAPEPPTTVVEEVATVYVEPEPAPAPVAPPVQPVADQGKVSLTENEAKDGYELRFPDKPALEIRQRLAGNGWRWSRFAKCWYHKRTPAARMVADALVG